MENRIAFKVRGRYALFTDPVTRVGGEKCSYQIPTYEALKGIAESIYWKPTFIWVVDKVRVMKPIRTEAKNVKPLDVGGGNTLATYTYLSDVEYQVQAHFVWNEHRVDLSSDRNDDKHFQVTVRMIRKGGRRDIFIGTRECQGYVEPCEFGEGIGHYDNGGELAFGLMFHGFDYPDQIGKPEIHARFWRPVMSDGVVAFPCPSDCTIRKFVREMNWNRNWPTSVGLAEKGLLDELA